MAANLGIYGRMTEFKARERAQLETQIMQARQATKALKKESLALLRLEQDFRREGAKHATVLNRLREERLQMRKELDEIREVLPQVSGVEF